MREPKSTIDAVFEQFAPMLTSKSEPVQAKPLTFWLPHAYKDKYDELQRRTRGKFGKLLKEVLKKSIDRMEKDSSRF